MSEHEDFSRLLRQHFDEFRPLPPDQVARLYEHWCLLVRWNRSLNLTTVTALEESVVRHYCESLFVSIHLPNCPVSVLDVGSGPGFPGIPMAISRPDCQFTLAESHQRKAVFLREASRSLKNVRVESRRAAELDTAQFAWTVSRAVRWQDVLPLASQQAALLLGGDDAAQIASVASFEWRKPVALPWGDRRFLLVGRRVSAAGS
jgi:16S rRNA (guanine527-N7)-methyltransferase